MRRVLCIVSGDPWTEPGGLAKYVREEIDILREASIGSVVAFPPWFRHGSPRLNRTARQIWGILIDGRWHGFHRVPSMIALLRRHDTELLEIQLHKTLRLDPPMLAEALRLLPPVPVRLILHDYSFLCPRSHYLPPSGSFCGSASPSDAKCTACRTPEQARHLQAIQDIVLPLASSRLRILAPARAPLRIFQAAFPDLSFQSDVIPHWLPSDHRPAPTPPTPPTPLTIAFAGPQASHKGWPSFLHAASALRSAPHLRFLYLGNDPGTPDWMHAYPAHGDMATALRTTSPSVVVLWSKTPETFCYALHEAIAAGAFILTNPDSGNIADAVTTNHWGRVLADEDALVAYLRDEQTLRNDLAEFSKLQLPSGFVSNKQFLALLPAQGLPMTTGERIRPVRWMGILYALQSFWIRCKSLRQARKGK